MSELDFLKLEGLSQTLVLGKRSAFHHLPLRLVITDRYELANALRPYARPRGAELPRLKSFVRRISPNRKPLETDDVARHFAAALLSAGYCALKLQRDVGGELPVELASDIRPIEATNIHNARPEDKYARVLELVPQHLPGEMRGAFAELVSPAAIGTTVGVLVLWAGSHALGVGFAIDVLLLAIGFAMVGWSIFGAVGDVIDFFKIMGTARNDADLNQAAQKLAGAIAALGVGAFIALLTRGAGRIAAAKKASVPRKSGGGGAPASDAQIAKYKSKTEDSKPKKKPAKRTGSVQISKSSNRVSIEVDPKTGRPQSVEATIKEDFGSSKRADGATKIGKLGNVDDDGGHLIAHRFMGDTIDEGIVPQHYKLNRGAWKKMENEWADWVAYGRSRGRATEIHVNIDIDPPGAVRPEHFYGNYKVYETLPDGSKKLVYKSPIDMANDADSTFDRVYFETDADGLMHRK